MQQQGSPLVGGCNDEVAGMGALTGDGIALAEEPWNEEPDDLDISDLPVPLRAMVSPSRIAGERISLDKRSVNTK